MTPHGDLADSGYCLANPGKAYLVYLPDGGKVTVDLTFAKGALTVEWLHPIAGTITPGAAVEGRDKRSFTVPFRGDAVLYVQIKGLPSI